MSSDCVNPTCSCGQHPETPCDTIPVEKTSAWTDADRERSTEVVVPQPVEQKPPDFPPWLADLHPGQVFTANGWECVVRHVGYEGGMWLMLVEPQIKAKGRTASRAEFRELRKRLGKKEAKRLTHAGA